MRTYTVVLEYDPHEPGYSVRVPALLGCYTQGDTVEEALTNAKEAIAGHLAALEQIGAPIPEEGDGVPADAMQAVVGSGAADRVLVGRVAA
jgi:predicted RNase H-like HicB family nuclease